MTRVALERATPYICLACRAQARQLPRRGKVTQAAFTSTVAGAKQSTDVAQRVKLVNQRIKELGGSQRAHRLFPRWQSSTDLVSASDFQHLVTGEQSLKDPDSTLWDRHVTLYGRVAARRKQSSQLVFLDVESSYNRVQIMIEAKQLKGDDANLEIFKKCMQDIKRGDWIAVVGHAHISSSGETTLLAMKLPQMLSPALQPVSLSISDPEFRSRNRHVERIVDPTANDVIRFRHNLQSAIRSYFKEQDFVEVSTPYIVAAAGGAVARPFETQATEFSDVKLKLRVAPELFLKRLIVGGIDRVFEMGSAFRNEGVDLTHNPEFSTCEFYQAMADLPVLLKSTEDLFLKLALETQIASSTLATIPEPDVDKFRGPYPQLSFIPTLESSIRRSIGDWTFPDLSHQALPDAIHFFLKTFEDLKVNPPDVPTLPRLLDKLASHLIEPLCEKPTWITYHPECMSPLAKSFTTPDLSDSGIAHVVSARAELFIQQSEYVNCYEEENDPLVQRRKFEDQIRFRTVHAADGSQKVDDETENVVDESYISALEWGMPPTGGWGCGLDRIIMLFSGRKRIADVLPFGTLTNVVAMGADSRVKESRKPKH